MTAVMDGQLAIDRNCAALKRILATLVAMAGYPFLRACDDAANAKTLPRHLRNAVLRLLRPAEAATRRLIIALARTVVVTLPRRRPRKAAPTQEYLDIHPSMVARKGKGTGIMLPPNALKRIGPDLTVSMYLIPKPFVPAPAPRRKTARRSPSTVFPLFDPLRNPFRKQRPTPASAPRIWTPGMTDPVRASGRRPSSPSGPINAARLGLRLTALGGALNDLPAQARRFAHWRARRDAGLTRRIAPLRPGWPPGCHLRSYDPATKHRRNIREIDEVLSHCHALAVWALERRDTS